MSKNFLHRWAVLTAGLTCMWTAAPAWGAEETNAAPASDSGASLVEAAVISNQSAIRANVQIQEQLHDMKVADEKSQADNAAALEKLTDLLNHRLDLMEGSLTAQRLQKLGDMQQIIMEAKSSNDRMLVAAIGVACFGCLVLVLAAFLQWQTVNRVRALTAGMNGNPGQALLGPGESTALAGTGLEQSTAQFLGVIDRLEKRIHELEDHAQKPGNGLEAGAAAHGEALVAPAGETIDLATANGATDEAKHLSLLLSKGQTLLKLDQADSALQCFEEILAADTHHAEALLARGTALERLQRLNEAIESYDRAIASDRGMTMAYLHKGGVFNRMERYTEALECYEQALKCQEKGGNGEVAAAA